MFFSLKADNFNTSSNPHLTTTFETPLSNVFNNVLLSIEFKISSGLFVFTINALSLYISIVFLAVHSFV